MKSFEKAGLNRHRVRSGLMASDDGIGNAGAFKIKLRENTIAIVIAEDGRNTGWEHASVQVQYRSKSGKTRVRTPNWEEMCFVKNSFWSEDECVIQFHPAKENYINNHPNVLHLWKPTETTIPIPPSILVGV